MHCGNCKAEKTTWNTVATQYVFDGWTNERMSEGVDSISHGWNQVSK